MFGRHPVFPTDVLSMNSPHTVALKSDYVAELTEKLACAHDHLARINEKLKRRMKSYYDRDRKDVEFEVGFSI